VLVVLHADPLQVEPFEIRSAAGCDEQLVERFVIAAAVRLDPQMDAAVAYDGKLFAAAEELDAVPRKRLLHDLGRIAVFAGEYAVLRLHEKHF
jgi:hypothetical protein